MSGSLAHSPADIIRNLLVGLGQGTTPSASGAWPVYAAREPSSPDSVITVFDTAWVPEGRFHMGGQKQVHYGIQVRVRDANPVDGFTKIQAIAISVDETAYQNTVSIGAATYLVNAVSTTGGVLALGKDSSTKRNIFTFDAVVDLRQTV